MELRRNELRLIFLYRLSSNSTYTISLDNRGDQNYVGNKGATKPTGIYIAKLKQGYMKSRKRTTQQKTLIAKNTITLLL